MNNRKVCVVTGSRAEYGLFYPILIKIQESNNLELQLRLFFRVILEIAGPHL